MYFPECFAMNAGISAMYFLKPPKSFTDKSSTKYAFIPYLANHYQTNSRSRWREQNKTVCFKGKKAAMRLLGTPGLVLCGGLFERVLSGRGTGDVHQSLTPAARAAIAG